MIIKPVRRYNAYSLCVLCAVLQPHLSMHALAAESVLQNKRLFFTESQRSGVSDSPSYAVAAKTSKAGVDLPPTELAPAVNDEVIQRDDHVTVRFTGVVASATTVVLLINGLPCKAIEKYLSEEANTIGVSLDCPHIDRARATLSWLPAEQQLIVRDMADEVVRLHVGESV